MIWCHCTKSVVFKDLEVKEYKVLNAIATAQAPLPVYITRTLSPVDTIRFETIRDVQIELYSNDVLIEQISDYVPNYFDNNYGYFLGKEILNPGNVYKLVAQFSDGTIISGQQKVPEIPAISADRLEISEIKFVMQDTHNIHVPPDVYIPLAYRLNLKLLLNLNDADLSYPLSISAYYYSDFWREDSNSLPVEDTSYVKYVNVNSEVYGFNSPFRNVGLVIDTAELSGQTTIPLSISAKVEVNKQKTDTIYLEISNLSSDYYSYIKSYLLQIQLSGNPFSQAQPVFSNIENGVGIFGAKATKKIAIPLN